MIGDFIVLKIFSFPIPLYNIEKRYSAMTACFLTHLSNTRSSKQSVVPVRRVSLEESISLFLTQAVQVRSNVQDNESECAALRSKRETRTINQSIIHKLYSCVKLASLG